MYDNNYVEYRKVVIQFNKEQRDGVDANLTKEQK
jgi:hypothetical protein